MITALNVDVFTLIFSHIPDFEVLCTTATAIETSEPLQCQGHSSLNAPSELNPPQGIPSPLFFALLVPQAEG